MHRRNLILALLVTGTFSANVVEGDENDFLLQIMNPAPEMTLAEATSDCKATSAELLPLANVIFAASLDEEVCGQCGSTYCWGAQIEAPCSTVGGASMHTFGLLQWKYGVCTPLLLPIESLNSE
jgi:hypothetical protein